MSNENQAANTAREYAAKMDLTLPATMEELAALQADWGKRVTADQEWEGSDEEVDMSSRAAFAFTALTGVDFEEELLMDYTLKATTPEIAEYMAKLLRRVMTAQFHVFWAFGYGDPTSDTVSLRDIIEGGSYSFESDDLVSLLALNEAGKVWTYEAMGERVVFMRVNND